MNTSPWARYGRCKPIYCPSEVCKMSCRSLYWVGCLCYSASEPRISTGSLGHSIPPHFEFDVISPCSCHLWLQWGLSRGGRYKISHAFTVKGFGVQYTVTGVGDHHVKLQTSPTTWGRAPSGERHWSWQVNVSGPLSIPDTLEGNKGPSMQIRSVKAQRPSWGA